MSRCVHGYLKRLCPLCKHGKSQTQEEWWMPYAEPLPTWETLERYQTALSRARAYPLSENILKPDVKSYTAGFSEADGYFGFYSRADKPYASPVYVVNVSDRGAVEYISRAINRRMWITEKRPRHFRYGTTVIGLSAIIFYRIIEPALQGHGREKTRFIIEHGFKVSKETPKQFVRTFPFGRAYKREALLRESQKTVEITIYESPARPEAPLLELKWMEQEITRHY